jgi:hypothetical protein
LVRPGDYVSGRSLCRVRRDPNAHFAI